MKLTDYEKARKWDRQEEVFKKMGMPDLLEKSQDELFIKLAEQDEQHKIDLQNQKLRELIEKRIEERLRILPASNELTLTFQRLLEESKK